MSDLTSGEVALLILITELKVVELREAGRAYSVEMNILKKLKAIKS